MAKQYWNTNIAKVSLYRWWPSLICGRWQRDTETQMIKKTLNVTLGPQFYKILQKSNETQIWATFKITLMLYVWNRLFLGYCSARCCSPVLYGLTWHDTLFSPWEYVVWVVLKMHWYLMTSSYWSKCSIQICIFVHENLILHRCIKVQKSQKSS